MTQPAPFSPMAGVYNLLDTIVRELMIQPTYATHREKIRETLRAATAGTRHYLVTDSNDLTSVWARIRPFTPATDFVMDVTTQLHVVLAGSPMPFETLASNIAAAVGAHRSATNDRQHVGSVVDKDMLQRMPTAQTSLQLMQSNPWYVTLILLGHRPGAYMGL